MQCVLVLYLDSSYLPKLSFTPTLPLLPSPLTISLATRPRSSCSLPLPRFVRFFLLNPFRASSSSPSWPPALFIFLLVSCWRPVVDSCPCLALPVSSPRLPSPLPFFAASFNLCLFSPPPPRPRQPSSVKPSLSPFFFRGTPIPSSTHLPCFQTPPKETPPFKQKPPPSRRTPPPFKKAPLKKKPPPPQEEAPPFQEAHAPLLLLLGALNSLEEVPRPQEEAPPPFKKPPPPLLLLGGWGLPRAEDLPSKKLSLEEATPPLEEVGDPYPIGAVSLGNHEPLFDTLDSSHPTLGNHEKHPPPFSYFIFSFPKPLSLLETMRNTQTPFHASFLAFPNSSYPLLGNHEKYPPPFSCFIFMDYSWEPWETSKLFLCFIFGLSKSFLPHFWEPWNTQTLFHASFLVFPSPSHPTLGNHEARNPFFMLHFWPSQTIPTTLLGTILSLPKPFPPHFCEPWSSQPRFLCFIFDLPRPIPPHAWEPWSTQTSLSTCFYTPAFHQAYSTKMTKHVLFQLVFCKTAFQRAYLTKHVLFQFLLQNGISPGILDKTRSLSAYLAKRHFTRHTSHSVFSFSLLAQKEFH